MTDRLPFPTDLLLESLSDGFQAFDRAWRFVYVNERAERMLGRSRGDLLGAVCWEAFPEAVGTPLEAHCREAMETGRPVVFEDYRPRTGAWVEYSLHPYPGGLAVFSRDVTDRRRAEGQLARLVGDLKEERETLDAVNRIGRLLSAELDLERLVQAATDAATKLTGAQFGAFFYNVIDEAGEAYLLYTISGAPREAFSRFPMPRNTEVFAPTFKGEGMVRSDDITRDPRYGKMAPHHGMPPGHLPVRSYLAVPVVSRTAEVLGGLFFGHSEPGVFTERAERSVAALVAQTAVAMDNARLYGEAVRATEQAQREIEERKRAEQRLAEGEAHQRAFLRDVLASVTDGRLRLCDDAGDLPAPLPPVGEPVPLIREKQRVLRRLTLEAAQAAGLDKDRAHDVVTAVNEAAMNAVVHAGGGTARVGVAPEAGVVQVWIEDRGSGIEMSRLPRATLDRGYTTAGTFGHGFKILLALADRVWLLTGPTGTTVVLEQGKYAPQPGWLAEQ